MGFGTPCSTIICLPQGSTNYGTMGFMNLSPHPVALLMRQFIYSRFSLNWDIGILCLGIGKTTPIDITLCTLVPWPPKSFLHLPPQNTGYSPRLTPKIYTCLGFARQPTRSVMISETCPQTVMLIHSIQGEKRTLIIYVT